MQEDEECLWRERDAPLVASTIRMSVFDQPVWSGALYDFMGMADCAACVDWRLRWVDFMPNGMPEGCLAVLFINQVQVHMENGWGDYMVPMDRQDDVLAWLSLLHMPVKCRVEAQDAEDD